MGAFAEGAVEHRGQRGGDLRSGMDETPTGQQHDAVDEFGVDGREHSRHPIAERVSHHGRPAPVRFGHESADHPCHVVGEVLHGDGVGSECTAANSTGLGSNGPKARLGESRREIVEVVGTPAERRQQHHGRAVASDVALQRSGTAVDGDGDVVHRNPAVPASAQEGAQLDFPVAGPGPGDGQTAGGLEVVGLHDPETAEVLRAVEE
ncbi:unannotated protein [freshwater metagenome]|uniref:Unannotated protein n=1 Tax=freshwater metagenome TaxID=449393 RepID=A0A6J6ENJ0_9ZZZZ